MWLWFKQDYTLILNTYSKHCALPYYKNNSDIAFENSIIFL